MKLLSIVLPSLLVLVPVIALGRVGPKEIEEPSGVSIEVRMREAGCSTAVYLSPVLAEVRGFLDESTSSMDSARDALELAYGDAVIQTAAPVEYIWVKINGVWILQCTEGATFEIDRGAKGTVVVFVRDTMPVSLP